MSGFNSNFHVVKTIVTSGGASLAAPSLQSGLTLASASETLSFSVTNNDATNPAVVDLTFANASIRAVEFDDPSGSATSPAYAIEPGKTRYIDFIRDVGANVHGGANIAETVTARGADGVLTTQTLTVEPFLAVTASNSYATFGTNWLSSSYSASVDFSKTSTFSVALWVKSDGAWASTEKAVIKDLDSGTYQGWETGFESGKPTIYLIASWSGSDYIYYRTDSALSTNTWHHVVWTYGGGNNVSNCTIYVNGSVASAGSPGGDSTLDGDCQVAIGLMIGNRIGSTKLDGDLDDVGIWNVELDSGAISELYTDKKRCSMVSGSNLVGYWDMDYTSAALTSGFKDKSSNYPNGLDMTYKS
jgi:hypothetical protein